MWLRAEKNLGLYWAIMRNTFITAAHIAGIMNFEADAESRSSEKKIREEIE